MHLKGYPSHVSKTQPESPSRRHRSQTQSVAACHVASVLSYISIDNYPDCALLGSMFDRAAALAVSPGQMEQLEALVRSGLTPQRVARKCHVVLLASQGVANHAIAQQTGLSRPTVIAARQAFAR